MNDRDSIFIRSIHPEIQGPKPESRTKPECRSPIHILPPHWKAWGCLFAVLAFAANFGHAATRTSENYAMAAETQDGGGQAAASATYSSVASAEPVTIATSTGTDYELHHGFMHGLWSGMAPVIAPDIALQTWENVPNSFVVTKYASDPDGDPFTVTVGNAAHGITAIIDGVITYTPDADYDGPDSFVYVVTDLLGFGVAGAVSVTVTPPEGNGLSIISVTPNSPAAGDVTLVFAGIPGALYDIEEATSLNPANWTDIGDATASTTGVATVVRTGAPASAFYRIRYVSGP